jgi:type IV fimbrial biogenesis protein FimT
MSRTPRGFTLIEIMVAVAVTVILLTVAVPNYINFMRSNKLSANVNSFVQALQFARLEARGRGATLCASADQKSCDSKNKQWSNGWIIFSDYDMDGEVDAADDILRVGDALPAGFTIKVAAENGADGARVTFGRQGFENPAGATHTFEFCLDEFEAGRRVTVNVAGSPTTVPMATCPVTKP